MNILKRNYIETELEKASGASLKGEYKLVVSREDGSIARETPWFDNLILDSGLNRWGIGAIISGAAIGTGTAAPDVAQTGLVTESAWTTNIVASPSTAVVTAPYSVSKTIQFRFAAGTLSGNYTEVAVGWGSGANKFSRALITDVGGSPTSISVGSSEALDIYYKLTNYPPEIDNVSIVTISGVDYTVTSRAARATTLLESGQGWIPSTGSLIANPTGTSCQVFSGAIGTATGTPSGTQASASNYSVTAYSSGSYSRSITHNFGLTDGNVSGGIQSVYLNNLYGCAFQLGFSPAIPKDGTKTLSLVTSCTWRRKV